MSRGGRLSEEKRKVEQEKLVGCLLELLKEEDNRYCADCDAKGPRWASWNLGVFLCIRCAGIHRNLGVHVSKVKSINLDSWTPEQVQSMRVGGNCKARAVYEANIPDHFRRPQSDSSLEAFIRAKYDHKRYIMKDWVKPKVNAEDLPCWEELQDLSRGGSGMKKSANVSNATRAGKQKQTAPAKLAPAPTDIPGPAAQARPHKVHTAPTSLTDLVDLAPTADSQKIPAASTGGAIDDLLGLGAPGPPVSSIQSSPLVSISSVPLAPEGGGILPQTEQAPPDPVINGQVHIPGDLNLLGSGGGGGDPGAKSKTDIMALYGSGGSTPTQMGAFQQAPPQAGFDPGLANQSYSSGTALPYSQHQHMMYANPQQAMMYGGMGSGYGQTMMGSLQGGMPGYHQVVSPVGYGAYSGQPIVGGAVAGQQPGLASPYGMQNVQNQLAGLNLQQANVPPGNTLSTNLWQ